MVLLYLCFIQKPHQKVISGEFRFSTKVKTFKKFKKKNKAVKSDTYFRIQ